jgi:hypothetical protein
MIDEKNHFWYYIIVLITYGLAAILSISSIRLMRTDDFILNMLWIFPSVIILVMTAAFALEECKLINLKRLKDEGIKK